MFWRVAIPFLLSVALVIPASASPTAVARYKDWSVFTEDIGGERACYAVTEATDKAPRSADHGSVWFYVSSWQSGKARNQPSLRVGYELRADLPGKAQIGRRSWTLFGVGSEAFSQDQDDPALVRALERGSELRVEATSDRNTRVTYHFSLSGSSDAIQKAEATCR
ncbi:MAG: invasion associated locus B family protein [Pseudomonadota bacterium]